MKKENDPAKLERLKKKYQIEDYFSVRDLPFELYRFEKGEYLNNELDPADWLTFVVSGTIRILNVRDDGSVYQIAAGDDFSFLGDIEFGIGEASPYLVEVVRRTTCISLSLKQCRQQLENDPVFLKNMLKSVAVKMQAVTAGISEPRTLKEKVLYYMREECPDMTLTGVEKASLSLPCSKRQLLRILRTLQEEGIVIKTGKGKYRLLNEKTGRAE